MKNIIILGTLLILSFNLYADSIEGEIKKVNKKKALIILKEPIEAQAGDKLKTNLKGVLFLIDKINNSGNKLVGRFNKQLKINQRIILSPYHDGKKRKPGFQLDTINFYLYGSLQLPSQINANQTILIKDSTEISTLDTPIGLGIGLEVIQNFSFSPTNKMGIGLGLESYMPQTLEANGAEFTDALLPLHIYTNYHYYLPLSKESYLNLYAGLNFSFQNLEHVSLSQQEMDMSIGPQFGIGFNFNNFEIRGTYKILNHQYKATTTTDADYNNIVFSLGYQL